MANYRNSSGNKAKFWVSEPTDNKEASSLVVSMNRMVGKTGAFSDSTPMNIEGITVYFVSGLTSDLGLYHYFYAKDNRVFWIQVDNPDESYRIGIVKESIKLSMEIFDNVDDKLLMYSIISNLSKALIVYRNLSKT